MEFKSQPTAFRCVDCDFKCCSANEMCRHIFSTRHGTRKCPVCDTQIVPRAFYTSLQKLIDRRRERGGMASSSTIESSPPSSPDRQPSLMSIRSSSVFSAAEPLTNIAISTHPHCAELPNFRCFERADFALPGDPRDYGLHVDPAADASGSRLGASATALSAPDATTTASATNPPSFRCMDCLNFCPTWTQVTKHIDLSGHTLPVCVQCARHLKCFGPLRPPQHEINCGHCGFYGVFYTRRDYRCDAQASRSVYNSANLFTGLFTLQYKCVCGISFLHPVHLAEHLRTVHHVACIPNYAVCHGCGMTGTLAQLTAHLQHPCWGTQEGGKATSPFTQLHSLPQNPIALAAVEIAKQGRPAEDDVYGLDDIAAMTHLVEVPKFSGAAFLQFRPLLPPISDDEVPLISEAHALASSRSGSPATTTVTNTSTAAALSAPSKPSYVVLYQCRECLFLFSTWDRIVQHIRATGHCRTFCTKCGGYLPELLSYSASEGSGGGTALRTPPQPPAQTPQQPQQQQQQQREAQQLMAGSGTAPSAGPVRSTTLAEHIDHLHKHGDIIGFPASPETLEVLVDWQAPCYRGSLDPSLETFATERTVMVYQCPAQHEGCYQVFLHYGDFVEHLLTTGHGTKLVQVPCSTANKQIVLRVLPTCYPMVTYRAKFKLSQLYAHFDFVECPYCDTAVPRAEEELHIALCVEKRRMESRGLKK